MAQNRFYSSTAQATTLNGGITNSATSLVVVATIGFPSSFPYTLILERDTVNEEVVKVTAAAGTTLTVARGQDGTSGLAHSNGATVVHGVSAQDFSEPQAHIAASSAVHGLAGAVVGTTDAQTLTNKTLTTPTINTPTISTPTITSATVNSGLTATNPASGTTVFTTTTGSSNGVIIQPGTAASIALLLQGLASQVGPLLRAKMAATPSGNFIECLDSLSNTLFSVASDGTTTMPAGSTIGGVSGTALAADRTAWTTYTPTFTNITSPTGTFAYKQIGKTLHFRAEFTGGTATASTVTVSLPAGLTSAGKQSFSGIALWTVAGGGSAFTVTTSGAGASMALIYGSGVIEVA